MYTKLLKRICDILVSLIGCILLSPIMLLVAILIKLDSKGPIFFVQDRMGKNKVTFRMFKFRTMYIDSPKDCPTHLLTDADQYITGVGRFLRKTSLDELPQLWNILKGDMSFVGPRPALWNQDDLIQLRDHNGSNDVRPGLTGWAQINGRDTLTLEKKAEYDGEYVKHISFLFDTKCILGTVGSVLSRDGIREGRER
ncbi:sugar transferase [Lachnoclostridium phytofermentans]|uniref:sugar transferase n=1 Tax=Lachnoclostridium phytofermentans TaxID=66219 RepID=UPI000498479D|nr:sugar transferase [Lachnoclostridium phytofermentans]